MHENPRATDEEQELAQTERLHEEEDMRGGQPPDPDDAGPDGDEGEED